MTSIAYDWRSEWLRDKRVARMGRRRHGYGPGGPWESGPMFGRRGPRAGRGDVRAAILVLLDEEPRNGYALMQEIEQRSGGLWRPSPGSVYPALAQLEDESFVRPTAQGSGRTFELTDEGRQHVKDNREQLGEPWTAVTGGFPKEGRELGGLIRHVATAAAQVMTAGNEEQRAQAIALLGETRRGLYRILAEADGEG
jgi:DNA-binding PadR family transcriptional regulator